MVAKTLTGLCFVIVKAEIAWTLQKERGDEEYFMSEVCFFLTGWSVEAPYYAQTLQCFAVPADTRLCSYSPYPWRLTNEVSRRDGRSRASLSSYQVRENKVKTS